VAKARLNHELAQSRFQLAADLLRFRQQVAHPPIHNREQIADGLSL
jgi:hypothetical protein